MDITITQDHIITGVILLLMVLQGYNRYQVEKLREDNKRLWDQISTFNTMIALKLLEMQQDITKLKENNNDGEQTKKNS